MTEPTVLCVTCRATFTEEQIETATCCPSCGTLGVPADLNDRSTLTLTHHEWRLLTIWASNWASQITNAGEVAEGYNSLGAIQGIMNEMRRQAPELPPLSLIAETQEIATILGTPVTLFEIDGTEHEFNPETKH